MGTTWYPNRDSTLETWDFEELANAPTDSQDPKILRWRELVAEEPSLSKILNTAARQRNKKLNLIEATYGVGEAEAKNIFKMVVGYQEGYGGYIYYVGPYFSKGAGHGSEHIVTEAIDRFGYYSHRYSDTNPAEVRAKFNKAALVMMEKFKEAGLEVGPSDFKVVERAPKEEGEKGEGTVISEIDNRGYQQPIDNPNNDPAIDAQNVEIQQQNAANNPEATDLWTNGGMFSDFTVELNSDGFKKLMKSVVGPWYEEVAASKAATISRERNIPIEEAQQLLEEVYLNDPEYLSQFYKNVRGKYAGAVKANDPRAMQMVAHGIPMLPSFRDRKLHFRSGQRQSAKVPVNSTYMVPMLSFRKNVIEALNNGLADVELITQELNKDNALGRQVNQGDVAEEIAKITELRGEMRIGGQEGSLSELYKDVDQQLSDLSVVEGGVNWGFKDFRTAFEMLRLYLSKPDSLKLDNVNNMMTKDLVSIREEQREEGDVGVLLTEEEINKDIGEGVGEIQPPEQEKLPAAQPVHPEPRTVRVPAPAPAQPAAPREKTEEEEEDLLSLLSGTLRNLIKIARDLDDSGKDQAAEEVHKVIRKYQKGVL